MVIFNFSHGDENFSFRFKSGVNKVEDGRHIMTLNHKWERKLYMNLPVMAKDFLKPGLN